MRPRKNTAPPLGPDACQMEGCGALAQTTLSASGQALRTLGFAEPTDERLTLRVCLKCYLRAMAEVMARAKPRQPAPAAGPIYLNASSKV